MFKKDQIIRVKLTDLAEKNLCYGKLDNGMSVFVNGLVTIGDIVHAKIIKIKKNYLICKFESFITKSSSRVDQNVIFWNMWWLQMAARRLFQTINFQKKTHRKFD